MSDDSASPTDCGWLQCTQCGYGQQVMRWEVEAGDYHDRQACPECCIGPCRIAWEKSDRDSYTWDVFFDERCAGRSSTGGGTCER